jgi:4-hydroxybenzoate decarboxylase subunit C
MKNTRTFIEALRRERDVIDIEVEVDPHLELAEIHRRVIAENGKVLVFKKVKGSPFPVATNMFGNVRRIDIAMGPKPEVFVKRLVELAHELLPPRPAKLWGARDIALDALRIGLKSRMTAPVLANKVELLPKSGLDLLPALVQWPLDGGRFFTLPLVYTEHPVTKKHNLGMYRIQVYDEKTTGMHWQIHKGGGFHYWEAEKRGEALPVTLMVGGPPALILSAIAPLPEDVPELMLASLMLGKKLPVTKLPDLPHPIVTECEFAFIGKVEPRVRRKEGPFGDHYGYYSLAHDYPVFNIEHMYHRDDAIWPATVVGKPRQEDYFIGEYLQKLLSPLFPLVMPSVLELKSYGETGFHALAAARVKDRYGREAISSALRILGEGQLSLQKFLMLTDGDVDLDDFAKVLVHFLERTDWKCDLFVMSNVSQDSLDYSGPKVNEGSKGFWVALGKEPKRALRGDMPSAALPVGVRKASVFVPGCLVIEAPSFVDEPRYVDEVRNHPSFAQYQLVLVVDSHDECVSSTEKFLWTWFTRFEPAADIHAAGVTQARFHTALEAPVFFDSRMKPWYPATVEPLPETVALVDRRWKEYFPKGDWKA